MAHSRFLRQYPALQRHREETAAAARARQRRLWIGTAIVLAAVAGGWMVAPPLAFMFAGIGAGALFFAGMPQPSSVAADELSGVEGEVRVLGRLRQLPDSTVLFNRLRIPDRQLPGGERELDFVVVGDEGVSVIEVKNSPGRIYVDPDRRHWPVTRRAGCGSRPSWNAIDNPLPQVRSQARALERWMIEHGLCVNVRPLICLAHPEVAVENADDSPIPVVTVDELHSRLVGAPSTPAPTANQREHAIQLLAGQCGAPGTAASRAA